MALKKSLSARRVPRKIGSDGEQDDEAIPADHSSQESAVKKPSTSGKAKKRSSLRMSFGLSEADNEVINERTPMSIPKRTNFTRVATENKAKRSSMLTEHLPFRADLSEDKPNYSKEYLAELKQSTPSAPKVDLVLSDEETQEIQELNIAAKFGSMAALESERSAFIPSEAEIREKKERRRRLAREDNYIVLNGRNEIASEDEELTDDEFAPRRTKNFEIAEWKDQHKYGETRLEHEDEDLAEGFDEYVEDGGISLGRKAEREAQKKRRAEMASMIADAEGGSSDNCSDDSIFELNDAYEAAQAKAGAYNSRSGLRNRNDGRQTPPRITPLPNLKDVMQRLRDNVKHVEEERAMKLRRLEELRAERAQVKDRETWIQAQLKETGDRYEKLRVEAGISTVALTPHDTANSEKLALGRGLENLGVGPVTSQIEDSEA
ncbi:hypothetical protein EJ05DRAFT_494996 [Pseudovirgaria hyperparasitica]|uniref:Uncharacterized protein n=1 Tax=Pseudovirgaria hyperparasitica TaxID=470096 RepID=A0A6A6VRE2_9PEZI|nr:uncharacterized protein EJ05DRAFT_494996 [Pseudovirgaria hyperparasitica]KAF2753248.1 hypothetical protein EJ05DRAFT_494996 [Pseudovirgaria hyperparasitica]